MRGARQRLGVLAISLPAILLSASCSSAAVHHTQATVPNPGHALLVSCDGGTSFPVTALDHPPTAAEGHGALAVALRSVTATDITGQGLPQQKGWRMLFDTGNEAGFVSQASAMYPHGLFLSLARSGGRWRYSGSVACTYAVEQPGLSTARWALDAAYPAPRPADTTLHLVVVDFECNDGKLLDPSRLRPPRITWTARAVTITAFVAPVKGFHACPGPVAANDQPGIDGFAGVATVVDLGRPLGGHEVLDGSVYPAVPARTGMTG